MVKLRYIDKRPIFFPKLKNYPGGIALPNDKGDSIINVTDGEAKNLLKQYNGKNPCYEVVEVELKQKELKSFKEKEAEESEE